MAFAQKPYRAFGWIIIQNTYEGVTTHTYDYPENREWYNLLVQGSMINNTFADGSTLPDYNTGVWVAPADMALDPNGVCTQTPVDNPIWWCVSKEANNNYLPTCEKWYLAAGETENLPQGTKLFFCTGTLVVGDKTITNPSQIKVVSTSPTFNANTDCYGIKFIE
tara:strand:- start:1266 stop:1760 length:495 start_codon:yes stop_codon:yes gene_type:complete